MPAPQRPADLASPPIAVAAALNPLPPNILPFSLLNALPNTPTPVAALLASLPKLPKPLNNLTIESPLSPKTALAIKLNVVAIAVPHTTTCPASLDKNSKVPVRISMPFLRASLLIILYDNSSHARFKFCK